MKFKTQFSLRSMTYPGLPWKAVRSLKSYITDVLWRREVKAMWKDITSEQL